MPMSPEEQERSADIQRRADEQAERRHLLDIATYELMKKMAEAQGINLTSLNRNKTAYDSLYGSTGKQSAAAQANAHSLAVMDEAMANLNKAMVSGTAATFAFGKALLSTEKSFAKYNDVLKNAGDAIWQASKNFGLPGMALGALAKGATMAAEAATKQADSTLKATDDFSKMGAAGSFTAKEVLEMGHNAGLTSKNIEYLTKATKTLGTATLSLGSTAGEGIAEFAKMTAVSSETRQAFQRLGIGQEELIQSQADFVSLQKASGVQITARMKQDGSLQKASLEYTKNLLELAAITGEDVEGAKKLQLEAQSELETKIQTNMMQQRINELQKQGTVESEAQAKALEAELKSRNDVLAVAASTKDAELKSATASFLATGAITEQSVMLKRLIPNIEEFGEKIKKGQDVSAEFAEALQKGTDANARSVGTAGMLDKTVAKTFGLTDGLLTWSAQRRDVDIKAAKDKAGKEIGKPEDGKTGKKTEEDPAQIARNKLTETEIKAQVELDKLILKFNPLINGFDKSTTAATALAGAAMLAAMALTAMAGLSALKDLKGLAGKGGATGGKMPGGAPTPSAPAPTSPTKPSGMSGAEKEKYDRLRKEGMSASEAKRQAGGFKSLVSAETKITGVPKPTSIPTSIPTGAAVDVAETASKASGAMKALGTVGNVLGKLAVPLALASAGNDAYQGYNNAEKNLGVDGRKATTGEKLASAAGGVLSGLSFGLISSETLSKGIAQATGAGSDGTKPAVDASGRATAATDPRLASATTPSVSLADIQANMAKGMNQKDAQKAAETKAATDPRLDGAATASVSVADIQANMAKGMNQKDAQKAAETKATQTAAIDPKLANSMWKEEQESMSKGLANMVKEDQERAKQAKEDAIKLTKASETQEVTTGTLNKTLLATNTALKDLTGSITNLTKPMTPSGGSSGSKPSSSAGGISVPGGVPTSFKASGGGSAMSAGMPSDMPTKSSKPTSQPPEEGGPASASKDAVDLAKIMKFGTNSGTQQNFEALDSSFKDAVTAAAKDYNATTGNKLQINSAKRDPADQQRIWDESVAAGREGKTASGMPIGKPGRSLHEKGQAVDIQNYKDPDAIAAMNKQGLTQKVPGDPVHFQAELGGILNGPTSGYPVEGTMHGREAIVPLNPDSIITKLLTTSEAQIKQEMNNTVTTNTSTSDATSQIMADLYSMMEEKFDAMIDALEDGNDHTEKLVKFSAV